MGPCDLRRAIEGLPYFDDPRVLAGAGYSDDAGIFRVNDNTTLVQTVDFFPPMVDDPYSFGQIAAANSLSDIFAMGATPLTALNIVGFPRQLDVSVLREILRGGFDKAREAETVILGGHTVVDKEVKYGLSVTGILTDNSFTPNTKAMPGDLLVLTKPLGIGIISTGIKNGTAPEITAQEAIKWMSRLNKWASTAMMKMGAHSATDITGFGLLGHARRMAEASGVTIKFYGEKVPVIDGTMELYRSGACPGGSRRNLEYVSESVTWGENIDDEMKIILSDAQTSGGLLISIAPENADELVEMLKDNGDEYSSIVGEVIRLKQTAIEVV